MTHGAEHGPPRAARRRWPWAAAASGIALVAFVLAWFQPQKLFIDERADDAPPRAGSPRHGSSGTTSDGPEGPVDLARGEFVSLDHGTSGVVRVIDVGDGTRVVRLDGLDTDNGPRDTPRQEPHRTWS